MRVYVHIAVNVLLDEHLVFSICLGDSLVSSETRRHSISISPGSIPGGLYSEIVFLRQSYVGLSRYKARIFYVGISPLPL